MSFGHRTGAVATMIALFVVATASASQAPGAEAPATHARAVEAPAAHRRAAKASASQAPGAEAPAAPHAPGAKAPTGHARAVEAPAAHKRAAKAAASHAPAPAAPTAPAAEAPAAVPPLIAPHSVWDPIPFGPLRKSQMVGYVGRHYGSFMKPTYKLLDPQVIVIHYTETPDFQSTYNTFAPDRPDSELHELPNTCAHFVIDTAGIIHQLVPLDIMCRHTVGLNWTAIGIEHVGFSDREILNDSREMASSLRLVRWLRCRYHIAVRDVIGHNESLASPFHREDVGSLRSQTHEDFKHGDMQIYRARLQAAGFCPTI